MPAKSKAQFRFMEAIAHGGFKKPGLSAEKAKEYVSHNKGNMSYKSLPETKFKRLKKKIK